MRKLSVGVLDYGMGNLRSVEKSLEAGGARVTVSDHRKKLEDCNVLVVPGQGAFDTAMNVLKKKKLDDFIRRWIFDGKPYLGICLGLQLLFDGSEEAPGMKGLGIFRGRVRKFRFLKSSRRTVPHMGWNQAVGKKSVGRLAGCLGPKKNYYFVHSYYADPVDKSAILAETDYGGKFCSAVARRNLVATQFHPEKSGDVGLSFLKTVLNSYEISSRPHAEEGPAKPGEKVGVQC